MSQPEREIRAKFSKSTFRVYQAYSSAIAEPALAAQKFVAPFKLARMTWIKPSFFWMMYRSGWATKVGQERILAIDISREGLEWALVNACLSEFDENVHGTHSKWQAQVKGTCVRVQWDPERDSQLARCDYRAIQIGLTGEAVCRYVDDWIVAIEDVTSAAHKLADFGSASRATIAESISQCERPYQVSSTISSRLGM